MSTSSGQALGAKASKFLDEQCLSFYPILYWTLHRHPMAFVFLPMGIWLFWILWSPEMFLEFGSILSKISFGCCAHYFLIIVYHCYFCIYFPGLADIYEAVGKSFRNFWAITKADWIALVGMWLTCISCFLFNAMHLHRQNQKLHCKKIWSTFLRHPKNYDTTVAKRFNEHLMVSRQIPPSKYMYGNTSTGTVKHSKEPLSSTNVKKFDGHTKWPNPKLTLIRLQKILLIWFCGVRVDPASLF